MSAEENRRGPEAVRDRYLAAFEGFERSLNGGAGRLHARRREAIARVADIGLPTSRYEAWSHTNPAPLTHTFFAPVAEPGPLTAAEVRPLLADGVDGAVLVFVDGCYVPDLSRAGALPAGVQVRSLGDLGPEEWEGLDDLGAHTLDLDESFAALSTAFVRDGAFISVPGGAALDTPVQVLHVASGQGLTTPRTLVAAGAGSQVTVIETFAGTGAGAGRLVAPVTEISVGPGAGVEYGRVHLHGEAACHAGTLHVKEAGEARFTAHTLCLTGRAVREDVTTVLDGEGIDSTLNGLFLPRARELVDNYTTIEHAAPNCSSHELYKGILGGRAQGVFRGKIHVHRVAQKTDAFQSNQNLLLSDDAQVTSKPQLEIYADDVRCSHGSTTGQLDAAALFYLRSRGVGLAEARRVLTRAFAGELVERVTHDGLRAHVEGLVSRRVDAVLAGGEAA
ncbi:MAG: Fe-S cluster assembly protein SufD [Gemmatimonadaceae bacterium]|nr:Fe-S cluster assembly protein SufD [Gemmatimonadaceae bacterium]